MTTRALKEIDNYGGIDSYMLALDEKSVTDSKHNHRVRDLIASTLFYRGELGERYIRRFGYHKVPPLKPEQILEERFKPLPVNSKKPNRELLTPVFKPVKVYPPLQ